MLKSTWMGKFLWVLISILSLGSKQIFAAGSGITYNGRLLDPNGNPVISSSVQFKIQIRTPGNENCLMYEEVQSKDMSNSDGVFTITINDGTGSRTDSSGFSLDQLFANRGSFSFPSGYCTTGTNYAPTSTDGRKLQVYFNDGSFTTGQWEPAPTMAINFIPMAIESQQVGGYNKEQLLKLADGVTTTGSELDSTKWTSLQALINGTSNAYMKPTDQVTQLYGASIPTPNNGQSIRWNSSLNSGSGGWENFTPGAAVSVTNVTAGTGLNVGAGPGGSITTTGTLNIDVGTTSGKILQIAAGNKLPTIDGSNLTNINATSVGGTAVSLAALTNGQVLKYNGTNWANTTLTDNDTLGGLSCVNGRVAYFSGSAWNCLEVTSSNTINTLVARDSSGVSNFGAVNVGTLKVNDGATGTISLTTPVTVTSYSMKLPTSVGTNGYVLSTDGNSPAQLSWSPMTASQWITTGNDIYYTTGKVGIGTTGPLSKLSLGGTANVTNRIALYETIASDFRGIGMANPTGAVYGVGVWAFKTPSDTNADFFVKDGGNVGIGNTNPSSALHITNATIPQVQIDNGGTSARIRMRAGTEAGLEFWRDNTSSSGASVGMNTPTGSLSDDMIFSMWNGSIWNERARITNAGKLGIGSSIPTYDVSLDGTSSKVIGMERSPSSTGQSLTLRAGGSQPAQLDRNGGDLILMSGTSTGTGSSKIQFQAVNAGSSGSTDNNPSTRMVILGSGNVGIGTFSPTARLHVMGTIRMDSSNNMSLNFMNGSTALGDLAVSGGAAQYQVNSTPGDIVLRSNGGKIFIDTNGGSGAPALTAMGSNGNVGIGVASPNAKLDVTDTSTTTSAIIVPRAANFTGTTVDGMIRYNSLSNLFEFFQNGSWVNYTTVSDGRLKTNVVPVARGLEIINQLNPVFFDWDHSNPRTHSFSKQHQVGFIAQEVEKVLPEVVIQGEDSYRSVEYGKMVSVVVAAVKELYQQFLSLKNQFENLQRVLYSLQYQEENKDLRIQKLENENTQLKERIEKIEKKLNNKEKT